MADTRDSTDEGLETVASGASLVLVGRLTKLGLLLGTQVLMARLLGATDYGGVVLATMLVALATRISTVGMEKGLLREVAFHEDEAESVRGAARAGLTVGTVTGTVAGLVVFLAAPFFAGTVFGDPSLVTLFRLGAVAVPLSVVGSISVAIARGARDATPHVIVNQLIEPIATFVLVGSLVVLGFGPLGAIAGLVVTAAATTTVALWLAVRSLPVSLRGPHERMYLSVLAFSLPLMFAASMGFVIHHTDTFLIGLFLAPDDVGIYNIAFQVRELGHLFFYPATFLLPPVLTRLSKRDEWTAARRIYQVTTKWIVLATTPVFLLAFFFPAEVIDLAFGAQYVSGATALRLLLLPVMVTVLFGANSLALIALGHNRVNLYVNGLAALTNVGLNLVLIPRFGIEGAAVASAIAYAVQDGIYTTVLYRWEGLHPFSTALYRPYLVTLALALVGYAGFRHLLEPTLPNIVGVGLAFLALYLPAIVALGAVEPEDERLLELLERRTGTEFGRVRAVVKRFN